MKRSWMKRGPSDRARRIADEARPIRDELIVEAGCCMICGASPSRPKHRMPQMNQLCCHEILNGTMYRQKTLAEPSTLLVLCWYCNGHEVEDKGSWPIPRQLAVLKVKSPHRYDLERFLWLRNPNAMQFVTEDEVEEWVEANEQERI